MSNHPESIVIGRARLMWLNYTFHNHPYAITEIVPDSNSMFLPVDPFFAGGMRMVMMMMLMMIRQKFANNMYTYSLRNNKQWDMKKYCHARQVKLTNSFAFDAFIHGAIIHNSYLTNLFISIMTSKKCCVAFHLKSYQAILLRLGWS